MTTKDDQIRILREVLMEADYVLKKHGYDAEHAYRSDSLKALAATSEPVDEWQSMDSAPRDGNFLVMGVDGIVCTCTYMDFAPYPHIAKIDPADYGGLMYGARYWMPIAPPKKENG